MKRRGILNVQLSAAIASLGHTDTMVIADSGLPVPQGVELIDLAVVLGTPGFLPVLDAVLDDVVVEHVVFASEAITHEMGRELLERFPDAETVPHEGFKALTASARFVVRTGEATPYANVILRSGVAFS